MIERTQAAALGEGPAAAGSAAAKAPPINAERGEVAIKLRRNGAWLYLKLAPTYRAIVEIEHGTGKSIIRLTREFAAGRNYFNPHISDAAIIVAAGLRGADYPAEVLDVGEMLLETGPIEEQILGAIAEFLGTCLAGLARRQGGAPGEGSPAAPAPMTGQPTESPSAGSSASRSPA